MLFVPAGGAASNTSVDALTEYVDLGWYTPPINTFVFCSSPGLIVNAQL